MMGSPLASRCGFGESTPMQMEEARRSTKRARVAGAFAAEGQLEAIHAHHEAEKREIQNRAQVQLTAMEEQRAALSRGLEEIKEENRILKRAVQVLNGKQREAERKGRELEQSLHQAADYVRKLEQSNYALRVHLQAASSNALPSMPPDVY
eukprot:scaffold3726_cov270-Pinguiococcus_pyrenoidosus.AAC.3